MNPKINLAIIGIGSTGISRAMRLDKQLHSPSALIFIDQEGAPERIPEHPTQSSHRNLQIPRKIATVFLPGSSFDSQDAFIAGLQDAVGVRPLVVLGVLDSELSRAILSRILNLRNTILWAEVNYCEDFVPTRKRTEARNMLTALQSKSMGLMVRNFHESHAGLYTCMDADLSPVSLVQNLWEVAAHCMDDYVGALLRRSADLERTRV